MAKQQASVRETAEAIRAASPHIARALRDPRVRRQARRLAGRRLAHPSGLRDLERSGVLEQLPTAARALADALESRQSHVRRARSGRIARLGGLGAALVAVPLVAWRLTRRRAASTAAPAPAPAAARGQAAAAGPFDL